MHFDPLMSLDASRDPRIPLRDDHRRHYWSALLMLADQRLNCTGLYQSQDFIR